MKISRSISIAAFALLLAAFTNITAYGSDKTKAFSSLAVSAGVSTYGIEFTLSAPLSNRFSISAAYNMALPYTYKYTYDEFEPITKEFQGQSYTLNVPEIDLDAGMKTDAGRIKLNFTPKKNGKFYIVAGLYFGTDKLFDIKGALPKKFMDDLKGYEQYGFSTNDVNIEVGDVNIHPNADGSAQAYLKTTSVKPYVGIGIGRNVPKKRIGFRAELGGIFIGTPKVESPNISGLEKSEDMSDFNELISSIKVYPNISFHLSVLLFRPKK